MASQLNNSVKYKSTKRITLQTHCLTNSAGNITNAVHIHDYKIKQQLDHRVFSNDGGYKSHRSLLRQSCREQQLQSVGVKSVHLDKIIEGDDDEPATTQTQKYKMCVLSWEKK